MATEQVLQWINNDLALSTAVSNFETDFSNGYLIGEILHHYGQVDLKPFNKKKNKEAKVNNFYLIETALRKLNVRFDGKLMHQIMEEERGASLRLLYQMKLSCQKLGTPKDDPMEHSMTNLKNGKMHTILQGKLDRTMELTKTIPPPTVGGKDIRTSKQKLADQRTLAYDVAQKTLFDSAQTAHDQEMQFIKSIVQEQRETNRTKLIENQTFMKEWIKEGEQNWKVNQQKREQAIAKVKYFEQREVDIYKAKLNNELVGATAEQINGIQDFQKNLEKLGIQQGISMEEAMKRQEQNKGIPPGQIQNFSYAATMNKIKETKKNSDFAGKDRDRRRRKMIVDQQNAQTKLDQDAYEAELIDKLLKQTSEEQQEANIQQRQQKCKHHDFEVRQQKAETLQDKREAQNQINEAIKQKQAYSLEQERKRVNEARRLENAKITRENKLEKRQLNIEIASGVLDLIMDLADETFDVVAANQNHQILNPEWRQLIGLFANGKKASLRHIKQAVTVSDSQSQLESLPIEIDAQAYEIESKLWAQPPLLNFYEYVSGSGLFNIPQLQQQLWSNLQDKFGPTSNQVLPNEALVQMIDSMYSNTLVEQEVQQLEDPSRGLKIVISGRAFSGKKTIAKQIIELVGNEVTLLHIDEIIKEAMDYISPKKVEEAPVDPKAKGKKLAEPVHIDIFEGKNTLQYKQTAQSIKELYFLGESMPQKIDLADLVLDDYLLNQLVVERLKLHAEGKPERSIESIKAGCQREREIIKQLEEIDLTADSKVDTDPKKKAKVGKGGPDPEKLQQELLEIRSFKAQGWVLIGYPRQLSQAKLFEQSMTGFQPLTDQPKSERIEIKESWKKLVLGEAINEAVPQNKPVASGLDQVLFIETPSHECVSRTKDAEETESSNHKRISQVNEQYQTKISSLKKWTEQFGLMENGVCKVALNQEVSSDDWSLESIKENALACVKKVIQFKQNQFDQQRTLLKEELEQMVSNQSQELLQEPSVEVVEAALSVRMETIRQDVDDGSTTNKSQKKKQNLIRYEITDQQKVNQWETTLNQYYRQCVQRFSDLQKQRKRVLGLFNQTQQDFLAFICREAPYQDKVNEFRDNFNRFSEQYPELKGKDETTKELLKRVNILNDAIWQCVLERKTQAVQKRQEQFDLMQRGWESCEKSQLVKFVALLMDSEFERFKATTAVVTGWVVNSDIDLAGLCNKLEEKATPTFKTTNGLSESPILDQVVQYLHRTVHQFLQDPCLKQQPDQILTVLEIERQNLNFRLQTLLSFGLLQLVEIEQNTSKIHEAFEQWIVQSIFKENQVCSQVVKVLKDSVEQSQLSFVKVANPDMMGTIKKVKLNEGLPDYLNNEPTSPRALSQSRFEIKTLQKLLWDLKSNSCEDLVDAQTFITIIIEYYQSYRMPTLWRNLNFQKIIALIQKLQAKPLQNNADSGRTYFGQSPDNEKTQYVNWRKVFLLFALAPSSIPTDNELKAYQKDLDKQGPSVSLEHFTNVDAWFDDIESAFLDQSSITQVASSDGEVPDDCDSERLLLLKELIWRSVLRTNEQGIRSSDLVKLMQDVKKAGSGKEKTWGQIIE